MLWKNWPKLKTGWIQFAWHFKISALAAETGIARHPTVGGTE